jgi:hypothetical protein
MIKAQADTEDDQNAQYLCAGIEPMYPGIFVKIEEDVHSKFINAKLTMQNDHCKIGVSGSETQ